MSKNLELRHQMFEMIEQWQQSGLTKKAFCEQQSIRHHSFFYWYKCYRQQQAGIDNNESAFLKLQVASPVAGATVEVHFPGGVRLLFHQAVSSDYIKSIIS